MAGCIQVGGLLFPFRLPFHRVCADLGVVRSAPSLFLKTSGQGALVGWKFWVVEFALVVLYGIV